MLFMGWSRRWLKNLTGNFDVQKSWSTKAPRRPHAPRHFEALALEALEDRVAPALQVTNLNTAITYSGTTAIQDAISDAATLAGHELVVEGTIADGAYENFTVNKANLLIRAAAGAVPVVDALPAVSVVTISAAGVELRGLRITDFGSDDAIVGISITGGGDGAKIVACTIDGFSQASGRGLNLAADADNVLVSQCMIASNLIGIRFQGGSTDGFDVRNNFITGNSQDGIQFLAAFGTSGGTIRWNQISGNASKNINNASAATIDASQNWWNTTVASTINATFIGPVDFTPYLDAGDADGVTAGFQADLSHLHVTTLGSQTGALGRIQEAVNDLADGALTGANRVIDVAAGRFAENVNVDRAAKLQGAQAGVSANARFASFAGGPGNPKANIGVETELTAAANNPLGGNPGAEDLIRVTASGVTIDGFVLDGNNAALGASAVVSASGVDIHARRGITNIGSDNSFNPLSNLLIQNDIIQNVSQRGVSLANNGPVSTGNVIQGNVIRSFGWDPVNGGQAVILFTNAYADILNNTIEVSDNNIGLHLQNFFSNGSMTWSGNSITVGQDAIGIHVNLFYAPAATLNVTSNTVNARAGVTGGSDFTWGINVWTVQVGSTVTLTNNTVGSSGGQFARGLNFWASPTSAPVSVNGGTVGNSVVGVNLDGVDPYYGSGAPTVVSVSGLAVTGGTIGLRVRNDPLGSPPLFGSNVPAGNVQVNWTGGSITGATTGILVQDGTADAFTASVQILGSPTLSGGTTGLRLDGAQAALVGNTLGSLVFVGQSGQYILLANGALDTLEIDALGATFDGLDPDAATLAQNFAIEDKITHALDDGSLGHIRFNSGEVFVTAVSGSIQRGVDAAAINDTVHVSAGAFAESVLVNKQVTLLGAQAGVSASARFAAFTGGPANPKANPAIETVITAPTFDIANIDLVRILASNVTMDGFVVDGNNSSVIGGAEINGVGPKIHVHNGISTQSSPGVGVAVNNLLIQNNIVQNVWHDGIALINPSDGSAVTTGSVVASNVVRNFKDYGILLAYNAFADIASNIVVMPDYATAGVWVYNFTNSGVGLKTVNITNNTVTVGQDPFGGIWGNLLYAPAFTLNIAGNTVNAAAGVTGASDYTFGIYLTSLQGGTTAALTNNIVGSAGGQFARGIALWNLSTAAPVTIAGGTIGNSVVGVCLDNVDRNFGAGASTTVNISGLAISGGTVGLRVSDDPISPPPDSGVNVPAGNMRVNWTGGSIAGAATGMLLQDGTADSYTASLQLIGSPTLSGGTTGLRLDGVQAALVGNTLGSLIFVGQSGQYILLANGALDTLEIDALSATFDGLDPDAATLAQNFVIEDKITHALDDGSLGHIRFNSGEVFVTAVSGSIQRGVDAAAINDAVHVQFSVYDEAVLVNKSVVLLGDGAPTVTRTAGSNQNLFTVAATNVTIQGFDMNVVRPFAVAGVSSVNPAFPGPIASFSGLQIIGNTITSSGSGGVYNSGSLASQAVGIALLDAQTNGWTVTICGNTIDGTLPSSFFTRGIWLYGTTATIGGALPADGNLVAGATWDLLSQFAVGANVVRHNSFFIRGIDVSGPMAGSSVLIDENTFSQADIVGLLAPSDILSSVSIRSNFNGGIVTVSNNDFTEIRAGAVGVFSQVSKNVFILNNDFTPFDPGAVPALTFSHILVDTGSTSGASAGSILDNSIVIQGNLFNDNGFAVGRAIDIQNHDTSAGSGFGTITVGGAGALANTFDDTLDQFIRLTPAPLSPTFTLPFYASPGAANVNIDASQNLFGVVGNPSGILPGSMSLPQRFELEDKLLHKIDVATAGLITVVPGRLFVTTNSFLAPFTTFADIQRAIDAASVGFQIHVAAGSFFQDLDIDKMLTLTGAGIDQTFVYGEKAGSGNRSGSTMRALAAGIVIEGFTISRVGNTVAEWNDPNLNTAGVSVQGAGFSFELRNSKLTGNRTAIDINAADGSSIHNNIITFNRTGLIFRNSTLNNSVFENDITDNWTLGVLFLDGIGNVTTGTAIFNNNISGNWYGDIENRANTGTVRDFSGNWFGTNAPTTATFISPTEPGYASQIPLAFGGGASNPGGAPNIKGTHATSAAAALALIDFSPYLDVGVDTNVDNGTGTIGFQGSFSTVWVTAAAGQVGAPSYSRIQEGYDLVSAGGTIRILGGAYAGDILTAAKAVTLAPGASPAQVTINGNFTLTAAATLAIELNGIVAGTGYDQFVVNGQVNLGGATLTLTRDLLQTFPTGTVFTLIANDGGDAVIGTFAGIADGSVIVIDNIPFTIDYQGGDGNDVTLTIVPPTTVWVDDDWTIITDVGPAGLSSGDIVATSGGEFNPASGKIFGFSAFSTIQGGIDGVQAGGTVHIVSGTYVENITVDKAVSLLGPNFGINPSTGTRVAEAVVRPAFSDPDPYSPTGSVVIYVTVSNVTIDGLTVDGNNTSISSGVLVGGVDVDAVEGISSYEGVGGIAMRNNIVRNLSYAGMDFYNYVNSAATSGNQLRDNRFLNIGYVPYGFGIGIIVYNNFYAQITGNVMAGVRGGIQTGNFFAANPGAPALIDGNDITSTRFGIWHNLAYSAASPFTISNNAVAVANEAGASRWTGIFLSSIDGSVAATVTNNAINAAAAVAQLKFGYMAWNDTTASPLTVSGGTVTGADYGVWVNNYAGYASNGGSTTLILDGVSIVNPGSYGVYVQDDPLNTNGATVAAVLQNGVTISGAGVAGLYISGADATASVTGSSITGSAVGVDADGGLASAILRSAIAGNAIGVRMRNGGQLGTLSESYVINNTGDAVRFEATAGSPAGASIFNNDLSGNAFGVNNLLGAGGVNASGNWWGTNTAAGVAALVTGANVDYTPWLHFGTDTSGTAGFQGDFSHLHVDDGGAQTGAVGRLQEGVNLLADGSLVGGSRLVFVHNGLYLESNTSLNKAMTLQGESQAGAVIAPGGEDDHLDSLFGGVYQHGLLVAANNVTILDLTIDGNANTGLAGTHDFRAGVVTNSLIGDFNNLWVSNIAVLNVYRRGIQISSAGGGSTGHVIANNIVNGVLLAGSGYGIAAFEADAAITGNLIQNASTGIATNYIFTAANAGVATIQGNQINTGIDVGMNLSGLAHGSLVGGSLPAEANVIDLTGGPAYGGIGIVVQYAEGSVTVRGNTFIGTALDSGMWIYHNESALNPVIVVGNTFTATGSSRTGAGEGVAIFITDDGSFFGDEDADNYAEIRANSVAGFVGGVEIYRNGTAPAGGRSLVTTIGGAAPADNNQFLGNGAAGGFGVRVFENDAGANGGFKNVATIQNNNASISGYAIGIDVDGGSAAIASNHVYGNTVGIRFTGGGAGSVSGADFEGGGDPDNGTDLRIDGTAGAVSLGSYLSFAGENFYIDLFSGQSFDLTALTGVTFDVANNFRIEDRMGHRVDTDRPVTTGRIIWVANNLYVTTPGGGSTDSTIQRGVDASSNGFTVNVEAGTYIENVVVGKEVEILGAGQASTFVLPSFVGANTGGGSLAAGHSSIFLVRANNVAIRNLTADGDNPGLVSGIVVNGADIDARNGIITDHTFASLITNLTVQNVRVRNIYLRGIQASTDFGTFNITGNTVTNVAAGSNSIAIFNFGGGGFITGNTVSLANDAISANWSVGTTFSGNIVTNSASGIHSDNNGGFGGGSVADIISGNTVQNGTAGSYGIWVFAPYLNTLVTNNIVTNVDVGLGAFGGFGGAPLFTLNTIDNNNRVGSVGAYFSNTLFGFGDASVNATIDNDNTFRNAEAGIYVEQVGGGSTTTVAITNNSASIYGNLVGIDVTGGTATITGNSIYGNGTGIRFSTAGAGSVGGNEFRGLASFAANGTDLRIDANAGTVTIGAGNNFGGGGTTLAELANPTGYFIDNRSGQNFNLVGGGNAFWWSDGAVWTQLSPAALGDNFRIEDRIHHGLDDLASGLVTWVAATRYVSTPGTGASDETIQRAATAANAGDTIYVEAGTYAESVNVTKTLTFRGAQHGVNPSAFGGRTAGGVAESTISPTAGLSAFRITNAAAANIVIDGFSLDGLGVGLSGVEEQTAVSGTYVRNNFIYGFTGYGIRHAQDSLNYQDRTNQIYLNLGGIFLAQNSTAFSTGATIQGNWIHDHAGSAALLLEGRNTEIDIVGNRVDANQFGLRIVDVGANDDLQGVVVINNSFTNSGSSAISNALSGPGSILLDASGNWYGVSSAAGVAALVGVNVDYTPWLDAGANLAPANGTVFNGDFSTLNVSAASPQMSGGRITEGIALLADGALTGASRVLNVLHGTYAENVNAAAKDFTFAFGNGTTQPSTVSVNGDVTFDGGNRLRIRLDGAAPGDGATAARFDRLAATGIVTLGGVVVEGTRTYAAFPGDFFDIVTAVSVLGSFGNASVVLSGVPFGTSTTSTTGRLTLESVTDAWVNDTWVRVSDGGAPSYGDLVRSNFLDAGDDPNVAGLIFGVNAFSSLTPAHAALVSSGGFLRLLTGVYSQSINLTKANTTLVAVIGAAPATLNPAAGNVITISAANVSIAKTGGADRLEILGNGAAGRAGIQINALNASVTDVKVKDFSGANSAGIRIQSGASAQLLNNVSNDNTFNIHVNGGAARIQGNDLRNYVRTSAAVAGILVTGNALVDAGMESGDASFTGFSISMGGNLFNWSASPGTGYWQGGPQAIVNLNFTEFVPPTGTGTLVAPNVSARGNDFGTAIYGNIEQIVNHHLDNAFNAWVDYRGAVGAATPQLQGTPIYYAVGPTDDLANQRSIIRGIQVVFDSPVAVGAGAFDIVRDTFSTNFGIAQDNSGGDYPWYGGLIPVGSVPLTVTSNVSGTTGRTTATITFDVSANPGFFDYGSLKDGNYTHNIDANLVDLLFSGSGTQFNGGTDYSAGFHRFFGDLDGDTLIDGLELINFVNALNVPYSPYKKYYDFNNDSLLGTFDKAEFDPRYFFGILP